MCVENLYLSKHRVGDEYTRSSLAHEPVASSNVYRRSIQGVWMYRSRDDRKTSKDCQSSAQSTANSTINT